MQYFDKTFWKMSLGFVILVLLGLAGVYYINHLDTWPGSAIFESKP